MNTKSTIPYISTILFLLLLCFCACKKVQRDEFVIHATIDSLPASMVYLEAIGIDAITLVDSTPSSKNGHFTLEGILYEPSIFRIRFGDNKFIYLFVNSNEITIKAHYKQPFNYAVSGSQASQQLSDFLRNYYVLNKEIIPLQIVYDSLYYTSNTDSLKNIIHNELDQKKENLIAFVKTNAEGTNYFQLATFYVNFLNAQEEQAYQKTFNIGLEKRFPNEKTLPDYLKIFKEAHLELDSNIKASQGVLIDRIAPNFTATTIQNESLQLSQFKNKTVIVYFWAPWNKKSIEESKPILQLKDSNIVVIGVSIDDQLDSWKQAIIQNNINGYQISTHSSWDCKIAKSMHVNQVPYFVIINSKGIVKSTTQLASTALQQAKEFAINSLNTTE